MKKARSKIELTYGQAAQAERAARLALIHLTRARDELKYAGAPKTLARVQLAISSAKGAVRNAGYRVTRAHCARQKSPEA